MLLQSIQCENSKKTHEVVKYFKLQPGFPTVCTGVLENYHPSVKKMTSLTQTPACVAKRKLEHLWMKESYIPLIVPTRAPIEER